MTSDYKSIEKELLDKIQEYGLSIKQFKVLTKKAESKIRQEIINSPDYQPKEYWSLEMASLAYCVILETNSSADEAMNFTAEIFNKPSDWVDKTKNNPFYYVKKLVNLMESHPVQKRMKKIGVFDINSVKSARTINQQLRRVSRFRKLDEKINELSEKLEKTQKEIDALKISDEEKNIDIDFLYKNTNIAKASVEEKIKHLYERGFTMVQISERVSVSTKTISRIIKKSKLKVIK